MTVLAEYREARRGEDLARLRRVIALRAMLADGMSQQAVADELGVSQPAISQQLHSAPDLGRLDAATVLEAGAPVLKALAADHGFTRIAVFGSVARGDAGPASDIDVLVQDPSGTSSSGLKPGLDDDIRREAVLL